MVIAENVSEVRAARWAEPSFSWGLVPTMGFLHEGHLSLVRRARAENDRVSVSVYVNPTQFSPAEDLNTYPRDLDRDLVLLAKERADLVFVPDDSIMYPQGFQTRVTVEEVSRLLEGASRPTHFEGVTTVVAKLFNILEPTRAYFGQKDAQQAVVIRRMAADLNFRLEIRVCPTVRERDGLAMSSRNVRLSSDQRVAATVLFKALSAATTTIRDGERDGDTIRQLMRDVIANEPLARLDYVSAADPHSLRELNIVEDHVLLSMAVYFGNVRLIDNMLVELPGE